MINYNRLQILSDLLPVTGTLQKEDLIIKPIAYKDLCDVVTDFHTHNKKPQGHKFSLGIFRTEITSGEDYSGLSNWIVEDFWDGDEDNLVEDEDYGCNYDLVQDVYVLNIDGKAVCAEPKPDEVLIGVASIGRPVSRELSTRNPHALEITRICFVTGQSIWSDNEFIKFNKDHASPIPSIFVSEIFKYIKDHYPEANKVWTYTRVDEVGAYLKAAGFTIEYTQKKTGDWTKRKDASIRVHSDRIIKNRWVKQLIKEKKAV